MFPEIFGKIWDAFCMFPLLPHMDISEIDLGAQAVHKKVCFINPGRVLGIEETTINTDTSVHGPACCQLSATGTEGIQ